MLYQSMLTAVAHSFHSRALKKSLLRNPSHTFIRRITRTLWELAKFPELKPFRATVHREGGKLTATFGPPAAVDCAAILVDQAAAGNTMTARDRTDGGDKCGVFKMRDSARLASFNYHHLSIVRLQKLEERSGFLGQRNVRWELYVEAFCRLAIAC